MFEKFRQHVLRKGAFNSTFRIILYQRLESMSSNSSAKFKDDLEIATNLFENSTRKFQPVPIQNIPGQQKQNTFQLKNLTSQLRNSTQKEENCIHDTELGLDYYRNSKNLFDFLTLARSHKQLKKNKKIIIEGRRLISEAMQCNLKMSALLFSKKEELMTIKNEVANAQQQQKCKLYKISQHELKMFSTLTTPPGLLAIFERPSESHILKENTSQTLPITVVCDNIREPNNLGSIIRTCAALPCYQIIVTKGCCDPWESKALRGGCGGHFRLLIRHNVCWSEIDKLIPLESQNDCFVFIAENNLQKAMLETEVKASNYDDIGIIGEHNILIIGGESSGVSLEAYKFLERSERGKCLVIPLANGVESLNVASAVTLILYEFRKQFLKTQSEELKTIVVI